MKHPYERISDHQLWYTAMSAVAPGQIDPVIQSSPVLRHHKVATIGSCFAQHISRYLSKGGYNYFVSESAPDDMTESEAKEKGFGVFSARYGNVYTVAQAVQLFDRAFESAVFDDHIWKRDSVLVDAFRPQIEPNGLSSVEAVLESRRDHLNAVRRMFLECDWLVFTLGLTEAWLSRADGAVFPIAPGVAGGTFDRSQCEFVNYSAFEIIEQLREFITKISSVNPQAQIILTVSPVPLIATYERRHVLVSTVASKSALRVAADEVEREFQNVHYFPSFEVVTSPGSSGRYFADDLRQVTSAGVNHVMRLFRKHYLETSPSLDPGRRELVEHEAASDVVCDEEVIANAIRKTGFRRRDGGDNAE